MDFIWDLFAQEFSILVAWVHANLLKGGSFWVVKIPQECTLSWRKILKLSKITRPFIKFVVVTGEIVSLWHDWWYLDSILYVKYFIRVFYDAACSFGARISCVLRNGNWMWKPARSK